MPVHISFLGDSNTHLDQFNAITAFVDASNIYGSHNSDAHILRSDNPGLLKRSKDNLLPVIGVQFRAGDARAREMPGLTSIHTIWMREHNRIGKRRKSKI